MPTLWLACLLLFLSRILLAAEFAVQETLLMRLVPDNLRGRVSTTDRAAELLVWSFSTAVAGWSLRAITPRTLTVISGLLSATSGVVWLALFAAAPSAAAAKALDRRVKCDVEVATALSNIHLGPAMHCQRSRSQDLESQPSKGRRWRRCCLWLRSLGLGFESGMNKPANPIREEHIDLSRFDDRGNFARTPHGMNHYLAGAIGAGHVIRFALN